MPLPDYPPAPNRSNLCSLLNPEFKEKVSTINFPFRLSETPAFIPSTPICKWSHKRRQHCWGIEVYCSHCIFVQHRTCSPCISSTLQDSSCRTEKNGGMRSCSDSVGYSSLSIFCFHRICILCISP